MGFEEDVQKANIKGIITGAILSALGFLIAFQWRDVIKETITVIVPEGQGLVYQYIAAILVTIIAFFIAYIIIKIQNADLIPDQLEEKVKEKKQKIEAVAKRK